MEPLGLRQWAIPCQRLQGHTDRLWPGVQEPPAQPIAGRHGAGPRSSSSPMSATRKQSSERMSRLVAIPMAFCLAGAPACHSHPDAATTGQGTRLESPYRIVEMVYDGGLIGGWHGNERRRADVYGPGPASISFASGGDWTISKPQLTGSFGALVFRMKPPAHQSEFLEVRVDSTSSHVFPRIKVRPEHCRNVGDDWVEVLVWMTQLNPGNAPFDRIVFRAFGEVREGAVLFEKIGLTELGNAPEAGASA